MAKFYWLKFDNQKISKKIYRISKFKAKCNLGHKWVWHGSYNPQGSGWYRKFTFEEYKKPIFVTDQSGFVKQPTTIHRKKVDF